MNLLNTTLSELEPDMGSPYHFPDALKLVAAKEDPWELYDFRDDRAESHNLVQTRPDKAKELEALWNRQLEAMSRLAAETAPQPGQKKKAPKSKPRERESPK
jgi:arylsulfatase A-like enzyme